MCNDLCDVEVNQFFLIQTVSYIQSLCCKTGDHTNHTGCNDPAPPGTIAGSIDQSMTDQTDQQTCNSLNEKGITTACFWGGRWVLWGPHTAAYSYGGTMDSRTIFDVNIRMLMHVSNGFQLRHGTKIDQPMTPQDRDAILNEEKQELDTLTGIGALIGTPSVEFLETENPASDMMNGDFVWNFHVTNTPPNMSNTARVGYTDEGFSAFFETA